MPPNLFLPYSMSVNEDTIFSICCETGVHLIFLYASHLTPPEKILLDLSQNYIQNLANFYQLPNQHHNFSHLTLETASELVISILDCG